MERPIDENSYNVAKPINDYNEKIPTRDYMYEKIGKGLPGTQPIDKFEKSKGVLVNNSILLDENKLLDMVKQELNRRGIVSRFFAIVPESFSELEQNVLSQMGEIDLAFQYNAISRDIAIGMIADLFERRGTSERFAKYLDSVLIARLKELYELLDMKYKELLHALLEGRLSSKAFHEKLSALRKYEINSMESIMNRDKILKGKSK